MSDVVVIVGQPNVGKSTLFNRLVGRRKAIAHNVAGVTRDNHYDIADWNGRSFTVVDTGGYIEGKDIFQQAIRQQVRSAINTAHVVLFVVDARSGLTPADHVLADLLRQTDKQVVVVVNKSDNPKIAIQAKEFYALGFPTLFEIAARDGMGTGDLLDYVVAGFSEQALESVGADKSWPRVTLIGKPNVGKSTLLNALLRQKKQIVAPTAHTTRDAVDSYYTLYNKQFILTDTAGIRKRQMVSEPLEFYAVLRSIKALQSADVCILLIDAEEGMTQQDKHLLHLAHRYKKGIVLAVNKWDLVAQTQSATAYKKQVKEALGALDYIPIVLISAQERQRIYTLIEEALEVYTHLSKKIKTAQLNDVLLTAIQQHAPPAINGKYVHIKYTTQLPARSPTFALFCNYPQYIKTTYKRYLEKKIRQFFNFKGVPISFVAKKK